MISTGMAVPGLPVGNDELVATNGLETSRDWIETRLGIHQRFISDNVATETVDLAATAVLQAAGNADFDMLIVATQTPDFVCPSTAAQVLEQIEVDATSFDVVNSCSAFATALDVAERFLVDHPRIVVVGVDVMSRIIDWDDRGTAVFFGDGAGAVLIEQDGMSIVRTSGTTGNHAPVSSFPNGKITMTGKDVWDFAQDAIPGILVDLCGQAGITLDELDWIIPHQGSPVMLEHAAITMNLERDVMQVNGGTYGNTAAASAAIMLHECHRKIKPLDNVAIIGFGAGLSWHGILFQA